MSAVDPRDRSDTSDVTHTSEVTDTGRLPGGSNVTDAPTVLIVLTDFPGEHYRMAAELGRLLLRKGVRPAYLLSSRYMERFKGEDFAALGPTFYVSELLRTPRPLGPPPPDQWWMHGSVARQLYLRGRALVGPENYRPLRAAVEEVFDRVDPALVWSEPPTNATLAVVHHVASDRGVEYWGVGAARIPAHFHMSRDFWATELVSSGGAGVPEAMPTGVPDYVRHTQAGRPGGMKRASLPARVRRALRAGAQSSEASVETGWGPLWQAGSVLRSAQQRIGAAVQRLRPPRWHADAACLDAEPSFFFPLHVRPEASTSMWARFHEHDLQTIHNLAFSLPGGATLVVKEHPAGVGRRPRAFYEAVRRLPNVRLAHPSLDASANVGRFTGVVVLTSTLGFEALLQGVPVLVLGRIFYEEYAGATRAVGWQDVTPWMRRAAAGELTFVPAETWPRYREHVFPGRFDVRDLASSEPDNIQRLAEPVLAFVRDQS